jgi:CDP-glucose 4,6-dehydratase
MARTWDAIRTEFKPDRSAPHEAMLLKLDCSKAKERLGWKPVWNGLETVEATTSWYRAWIERREVRSREDIARYVQRARLVGLEGL